MKILVIGSGFIGSAIIERLESEGNELLIFSRTFKPGIRSRQVIGDIFDFDNFVKILQWDPQVIIHTAWITAHDVYGQDPSNSQYAQFTSVLATTVSQTNLEHLIVLGSCAEYGPQGQASTAGITKLNPTTFYAKQKVVALNATREALRDSKVRLSWARIFQPYGRNQDSSRLLPYLVNTLRNSKVVKLKDTSTLLDWITTRDIAAAISWIISHDTPTEIDIGTSVGYTNVEFLKQLEALLGETKQWARIAAQPQVGVGMTVVGKDSSLFISGWFPGDTLETGLDWVISS
jgi:nucleoside-diphosphate-sugar epimerase